MKPTVVLKCAVHDVPLRPTLDGFCGGAVAHDPITRTGWTCEDATLELRALIRRMQVADVLEQIERVKQRRAPGTGPTGFRVPGSGGSVEIW